VTTPEEFARLPVKWVTVLLEESVIVQREAEIRAKGGKVEPVPEYEGDEPIDKLARRFREAGFQVEGA